MNVYVFNEEGRFLGTVDRPNRRANARLRRQAPVVSINSKSLECVALADSQGWAVVLAKDARPPRGLILFPRDAPTEGDSETMVEVKDLIGGFIARMEDIGRRTPGLLGKASS